MPFKEKSVVRHRLRPEWGAGRILVRTEDFLQIDFTAGGLKKLKTAIADDHLESATDEEVKALRAPKAPRAAPKAKEKEKEKETAAPKRAVAGKATGKTRMV
jgi:hypothetical protein